MVKQKSISDYFDTKRKIDSLKKLALDKAPYEPQAKLLNDILTGTTRVAIELLNEGIYRARWNDKGRLFTHISELIYPPARVAKKGRFNNKNQSIFYGALCELGTIIELRPELNIFFTITKFKPVSSNFPLFVPVGIKNDDGITDRFSLPANINKTQQLIVGFLNSEITKQVASEDDYDLTILIGENCLNHSVIDQAGKVIQEAMGIAYSSVQSRLISNTTTRNIAMTPTLFHKHYVFEEAFVYNLTHEPNHIQLNPINQATIDSAGNVLWMFSFEEMKKRVSQGLLSHGHTHTGIIGMQNLL